MVRLLLILTYLHYAAATVPLVPSPPPCLPARRDFKLYYPCTGQEIRGAMNDNGDDAYDDVYRSANDAGFYNWLFLHQNRFAYDGTARWPSYGYNPNLSELRIYRPP